MHHLVLNRQCSICCCTWATILRSLTVAWLIAIFVIMGHSDPVLSSSLIFVFAVVVVVSLVPMVLYASWCTPVVVVSFVIPTFLYAVNQKFLKVDRFHWLCHGICRHTPLIQSSILKCESCLLWPC